MTRRRFRWHVVAAVMVALAAATMTAQKTDTAQTALRAAIDVEMVKGDLAEAIKQYQVIVDTFGKTDRAVAAQALLRMADCYRKSGDEQAKKLYERIVSQYVDQREVAAVARTRTTNPPLANHKVWTVTEDPSFDGRVSPDGRYLAYRSQADGDLYLHDFATERDTRLTNTSNYRNYQSLHIAREMAADCFAFSRDSRQLAFSWHVGDREELRVITLAGTSIQVPRVLVSAPDFRLVRPFDWSPDGTSIVVGIWRSLGTGSQLGVLSLRDGTTRSLTSSPNDRIDAFGNVAVSPDGRQLAYNPDRDRGDNSRDIVLIDLQTNSQTPLITPPKNDKLLGWSPDGGVVFASERTGQLGIWMAAIKSGVVDSRPLDLKPWGYADATTLSLGMTMAGALYYRVFPADLTDVKVASMDFATGRIESVPVNAANEFVESSERPVFSSDGTQLAFVSRRPNNVLVIVVRSLETGATRDLPTNMLSINTLSWSPDGSAFFCNGILRGVGGLHRIDATTGQTLDLDSKSGVFRQWSEDGKTIFYDRGGLIEQDLASGREREIHKDGGGQPNRLALSAEGRTLYYRNPMSATAAAHDLMAKDLATGRETVLVGQRHIAGVFLSPDGRFIVTSAPDQANRPTMLLVPTDGSGARELPRDFALVTWSPDSRSLIATRVGTTPGGPRSTYWWIPIDGREPRPLTLPDSGRPIAKVVARGRWLAFQEGNVSDGPDSNGPSQIWVLENFLPKPPGGRGAGGVR